MPTSSVRRLVLVAGIPLLAPLYAQVDLCNDVACCQVCCGDVEGLLADDFSEEACVAGCEQGFSCLDEFTSDQQSASCSLGASFVDDNGVIDTFNNPAAQQSVQACCLVDETRLEGEAATCVTEAPTTAPPTDAPTDEVVITEAPTALITAAPTVGDDEVEETDAPTAGEDEVEETDAPTAGEDEAGETDAPTTAAVDLPDIFDTISLETIIIVSVVLFVGLLITCAILRTSSKKRHRSLTTLEIRVPRSASQVQGIVMGDESEPSPPQMKRRTNFKRMSDMLFKPSNIYIIKQNAANSKKVVKAKKAGKKKKGSKNKKYDIDSDL